MLRVRIQVSGILQKYAHNMRISPDQREHQVTQTRPFSKLIDSIWVLFVTEYTNVNN